MIEVVMDSDLGKRRRLPAWMLQTSLEHEPRDSAKGHETRPMLDDRLEHQEAAAGSKLRALSRKRSRSSQNAVSESSGNLEITAKRHAKRRTTKETQNYSDKRKLFAACSGGNIMPQLRTEEDEIAVDKKKTMKKENKKLKRTKSSEPVISLQWSENDIDITVEDLIFIAKEYVDADRMKQQDCSGRRKSGSETCTSNSSVCPETDVIRPLQSGSSKVLMKCTEARSSSKITYNEMNVKGSQGAENFVKSTTSTGDAAQDMLDLLLGPLLKKPPVKEHEPKEVILENVLSDNDKQVRKEIWKEVSFTKKKGSLKNQVAMLLE